MLCISMIITGKDFEMIFIGSMSFDFEKKINFLPRVLQFGWS